MKKVVNNAFADTIEIDKVPEHMYVVVDNKSGAMWLLTNAAGV